MTSLGQQLAAAVERGLIDLASSILIQFQFQHDPHYSVATTIELCDEAGNVIWAYVPPPALRLPSISRPGTVEYRKVTLSGPR